jgi:hypothetical protein
VVFPGAYTAFKLLLASPCVLENMLGFLMAFPIALTPKDIVTGRKGAAVRLVVTFHVLPDPGQYLKYEVLETTYRKGDS